VMWSIVKMTRGKPRWWRFSEEEEEARVVLKGFFKPRWWRVNFLFWLVIYLFLKDYDFSSKTNYDFFIIRYWVRSLYATHYNLICKNILCFLGHVSDTWLNKMVFLSQLRDIQLNKNGFGILYYYFYFY
jgi:hypothetical protein